MYYLLSLYRVTLLRLWGKCDKTDCLIVFVVLKHLHCLHDKCWYLSSQHVRCGKSRPTYGRTAQDMQMMADANYIWKLRKQAYIQKSPFNKIPALEYSSDEIYLWQTCYRTVCCKHLVERQECWLYLTSGHAVAKQHRKSQHFICFTMKALLTCNMLKTVRKLLIYSGDHILTRIHSTDVKGKKVK